MLPDSGAAATPLHAPLQVLNLKRTHLIEADQYKRFTLVLQAWGSVKLGLEALRLMVPEVGTAGAMRSVHGQRLAHMCLCNSNWI